MKTIKIAVLLAFLTLSGISLHASEQGLSPLAASGTSSYLMTKGAIHGSLANLCGWGVPVTGLAGAYLLHKYKKNHKKWQKYTGIALLGTAAVCVLGCVKSAKLSTMYWNAYTERMNWASRQ